MEDKVGKRSISRKRRRGRERGGILRTERKGGYESCWENRIAKKMVEDLCLLRLRDVSIKKLQARGGLLCDPKKTSMVIPIQNVLSVILKCKCLNWRGPKLDAAYFKAFRW